MVMIQLPVYNCAINNVLNSLKCVVYKMLVMIQKMNEIVCHNLYFISGLFELNVA